MGRMVDGRASKSVNEQEIKVHERILWLLRDSLACLGLSSPVGGDGAAKPTGHPLITSIVHSLGY